MCRFTNIESIYPWEPIIIVEFISRWFLYTGDL